MRRLLALVLVIASLCVAQPAVSQGNGCVDQVFSGTTLRYTLNYGASYQLASPMASYTLRGVYACAITSPVTLGQYQPVGFMADQHAIVVYASPNGQWYYVHREWRVYALTAWQWQQIAAAVNIKVAH